MKVLLAILVAGTALLAQTPSVSSGGVLNSASYATTMPVAPGSLISIFGSGLAATTATADSVPLSNSLGNVSVSINGTPAPLNGVFHESSFDQINAQLPWNAQTGTAQVVVTNNGVASAPQSFQVGQFAPGIFTVTATGTGQAVAVNFPDNTYAAPAGSIPGVTSRPAVAGDPNGLIIYATGLGAVNPAVANGAAASANPISFTTAVPTVLVGGVAAKVNFSGLAPGFVGLNQLNVVLASTTPTGNQVSLQIQMNGVTSTNQVTIAVAAPASGTAVPASAPMRRR
jgi:uncharacterized protein (TIGR03437 family)